MTAVPDSDAGTEDTPESQCIAKICECIKAKTAIPASLSEMVNRFPDSEKVAGWLFCHQVYTASPEVRLSLLRDALSSSNARIREQVCDIVGDEQILELRDSLRELFNDPVDFVREAAEYNCQEMFE
jgi:hypothetical protein